MSSPTEPADLVDAGEFAGGGRVGADDVRGRRVALAGRFGGMNRREAANVVRSFDATVVDLTADAIDWVVIGAEESPLAEAELLTQQTRDAAARGQLEILCETELWQRLGLVDIEQSVRRYHTPAMLAHLLGVSVRVIRRWHRRGLITPVRTLHKLPYFDFQEVATARRLAQWIAAGASPQAIERRLVEWVEVLPNMQRPLDQLSILIEGKHVLLRQGEGLLEPGGQMRFDFDSLEEEEPTPAVAGRAVLQMTDPLAGAFPIGLSIQDVQDELLEAAYEAEEKGELATAVDYCHAILARDGPRADICFLIGELLDRDLQSIAARERFYMAIELDPEFVEARASLAGILAETGQRELAVAAYRGALDLHDDYPDAHYNLARVLDDLGRDVEATHHWKRFLILAPDSPWAAEAQSRLSDASGPT